MLEMPARKIPTLSLVFIKNKYGTNLKTELRNIAKKHDEYHTPITLIPYVNGGTDDGKIIKIDNLGKWLFGTPGYKGHIKTVIHENDGLNLCEIYTADSSDLVINLLVKSAEELGLIYLGSKDIKLDRFNTIGDKPKMILNNVWENIRSLFIDVFDIGKINFDYFDYYLEFPLSYSNSHPIGLKELFQMEEEGRNIPQAQGIYAECTIVALLNNRIFDYSYSIIFGEFVGSLFSGWSCRFGNIDNEIAKLEEIYSESDGVIITNYDDDKIFMDKEVKKRMTRTILTYMKQIEKAKAS